MGTGESPSFCVVPWLHRLVDEGGFLKVCCVAEGAANFLTDERGRRLHIQRDTREDDVVNSPRLKELRRKMIAGEWDAICRRCGQSERAGGHSSRTGRNRHFVRRIPGLLADTAPDGTVGAQAIRHVDLRLGNHCNLTCRMCSPGASKLWIEPYNRVQPERYQLNGERLDALRTIEWVSDPAVWARFREMLPSVEWLHFAGGEPMMIPEMIEVLQMCVEIGVAGQIDLSYNTNITLLPERVGELWPRFKSVSLSCSIDGYGALNEYIRRPSKWRDVDRHLRTLDAHFREWNLLQVAISATVQVYNILDLDKLYAYLRSEFAHVLPAPELNPLSWPAYLSVQTLPPAVKHLARARLRKEQAREQYRRRDVSWLISSIDTLIDYMDRASPTDQRDEFLSFTMATDREFRDSFTRAAPELAAMLEIHT